MYPNPEVVAFVRDHFIPVRLHVREQADDFKRIGGKYGAQWTPTTLVVDHTGEARHKVEGFLPATDLLAQLTLGLGHSAFARGEFAEAERWYRQVVEKYPGTEAAPEALYWTGVARYKATGEAGALGKTAREFKQRYQDTSWAKKASVWDAIP